MYILAKTSVRPKAAKNRKATHVKFHTELSKVRNTFEVLLSRVEKLKKNRCNVTLRITYHISKIFYDNYTS